jgi:hypothetical protein
MRRVIITFWALVAISVLAVGGLSRAVSSPPSAATGLAFLLASAVLIIAGSLAARILVAVWRER